MALDPESAKVKKILDACLKDNANRVCAECSQKRPLWASSNLGVFVCIRCSGIHRNLGVHISKVKSVSLDKWPVEQAEFMAKIGNAKANAFFEATLPANRKPTENDSTYVLENFIRDKYERRLWVKPAGATSSADKKAKKKKKKKADSSSESSSDSDSDSSDSSSSEDEETRRARQRKEAKEAKRKKEKEEAAAKEAQEKARAAAAAAAAAQQRQDSSDSDDEEKARKARKAAKKAKREAKEQKKSKSSSAAPAAAAPIVADFSNLSVSNGAAQDDGFGAFESSSTTHAQQPQQSSGGGGFDNFFDDNTTFQSGNAAANGAGSSSSNSLEQFADSAFGQPAAPKVPSQKATQRDRKSVV